MAVRKDHPQVGASARSLALALCVAVLCAAGVASAPAGASPTSSGFARLGDPSPAAAAAAVGAAGVGTFFQPTDPVRLLDSRGANGGWNGKLAAGAPRSLTVKGGVAAVPSAVDAVVLNVTVTGGSQNSFLTVYPTGSAVPNASNVNFAAGETVPNLVTVKVGQLGQVSFANAAGATHVIADLVGYYSSGATGRYSGLAPTRILDSRGSKGGWNTSLAAGAPRPVAVRGANGIPGSAVAVIMNVTVTGGTANSFLTAFPSGGSVPVASSLNFAQGQTIANLVTVKLGADGQVSFINAAGSVHVVADVVGYFDPVTGSTFHSLAPSRILDSRGATGGWGTKLSAGTPRSLIVAGAEGVDPGASAVIANITVTNATANSFLTAFPTGGAVPTASNVNFAAGQTASNLAAVKLGTGGQIAFANATGATDVVVDVTGYFGGSEPPAAPVITSGSVSQQSVSWTWSPPANTGDSPLASMRARVTRQDGAVVHDVVGMGTSLTLNTGTWSTNYTLRVTATNQGNNGQPGQPGPEAVHTLRTADPPPPGPTVTASFGSARSGCGFSPCNYFRVQWSGFSAGGHTVHCHTSQGDAGFVPMPVSGASGDQQTAGYCWIGSAWQFWVDIDGVQSNHITR